MGGHWFWYLLSLACIVWYSIVTGYVAVRGAMDIRTMLRHLGQYRTEP